MKTRITSMLVLTAVTIAGPAIARSVYLNGFDISSVRDKRFENATVVVDADGNIRIEAPQYDVKVVPREPESLSEPRGPNPSLTQKYYLVTKPAANGNTGHDITITVNGKPRRVIKAGSPQVIVEISAWLNKGANEIVISADRPPASGQAAARGAGRLSVIIGTGRSENKIVKISEVLGRLEVDAATADSRKEQLRLDAR